jgi:hypothetical protein
MGEREQARLDSWKEIAEYLGRDVRTAIRWEHERGLPVHRVPGGRRGVVFAYGSEIDRWRAGPSPNGAASGVEAPAPFSPADATARAGRAAVGGDAPPSIARFRDWRRVGRLGWLGGGLAVVGLLAAGAAALVPRGSLAPGSASQPRLGLVEFGPREIIARTEAGDVAWRHEFERPLVDLPVEGFSRKHAIADLDGDGSPEVVATATLSLGRGVMQDELTCFSSTGEVRWRTRLDDRVAFRGGTFGPPWIYGFVAV